MSRKVIVHIGAGKTGSSSIQSFLSLNVNALGNNNIIVPDISLGISGICEGHQVWAFENVLEDLNAGAVLLKNLIKSVENKYGSRWTILLSAENLSNRNGLHNAFKAIRDIVELSIVFYVRRQDEYFQSAWQQWYSKVEEDFWTSFVSRIGKEGDWQAVIEDWETVVPRKSINVRIFENHHLVNANVVDDYCQLLAEDLSGIDTVRSRSQSNPTLSQAVMLLIQDSKHLIKDAHDTELVEMVLDLTGSRFIKSKNESMLTYEQRAAITNAYAKSNSWVKEHYFPKLEGGLFSSVYESQYEMPTIDSIIDEQRRAIFSMISGLYKKLK